MNIKDNIVNYLFDKDYIVTMYEDYLYVFNYRYLDYFNDKTITLSLKDRKITLNGVDLLIVKMTKEEILIKGHVKNIEVKLKDE